MSKKSDTKKMTQLFVTDALVRDTRKERKKSSVDYELLMPKRKSYRSVSLPERLIMVVPFEKGTLQKLADNFPFT